MKRPTRILAMAGTLIVLVLALVLVLPLLFRDRIVERVKTGVNQSLNARVDWRDLSLTFFRNFPNLTLTLDGLTAAGVGRLQGDTLILIAKSGRPRARWVPLDPFDRLLAAQAELEGLSLVTRDPAFQPYEIDIIPA